MGQNNNALNITANNSQGNKSFQDMSKDNQRFKIIKGLNNDYKNVTGSNVFPVEVFPIQLQQLIGELKNTMNFPVDYSAASLLFAVSVAIGNKLKLKVKNGWVEKSILYIILVGRTGDIKSHTVSFFIKSLMEIDRKNYLDYLIKRKEFDALDFETKTKEAQPVLKQLLLNDFTPEAFIKAHFNNTRGIGLYSDEIAGFINSFNRYHKGSDEELYLSLWAGKPIVKNRVSGEEIRIDNPKIDIIGTIQEAILGSVFQHSKLKNGFIDRFLFAFPHKYVDNKWNDRDLDQSFIDQYTSFINEIISLGDESEILLEFETEAKKYLYDWQNSQKMIFDFEYQRGIAVKLQQYVLRFSILLEVMSNVCHKKSLYKISIESVKAAILLRDYFFENAVRVFETIDLNYIEGLTEMQKKVFEILPNNFKMAEAKQLIIQEHNLMKERSLKAFLNDRILFKKISYGQYEKQVI